jgi:HNH endonuclease
MAMAALQRRFHCMYCGELTKRGRRGEHVLPEAIGGALTLLDVSDNVVCTKCNTGFLSQLDKELCSRSFLSAVASQQIDAHLWQAWNVDHQSDNLLVEARPSWAPDGAMNSLVCYPQITLERSGRHVRGDPDEFHQFGGRDFAKVLFKAARRCFDRYRYCEKGALHFERIDAGVILDGYRLAPRVFTRHSIYEIARNVNGQSFILRFCNEEDKRFALRSLSNLTDSPELTSSEHKPGSRRPTICYSFDVAMILRALIKLGLNLVAAYCRNTPVNCDSFAQAMRIVRGEMQDTRRVMAANGFVYAEDVEDIKAEGNDHAFRLVHMNDTWHVYSCFFGGKIGSYVQFPGPSQEEWRSAHIVAPLRSKNWSFRPSPLLPAKTVRVSWQGSTHVTPSIKLRDTVSSLEVSVVEQKQPPRGAMV